MKSIVLFFFMLLGSATLVLSAPTPVPAPETESAGSDAESQLEKRAYSGKGTWYNAGMGACGKWNSGSDKIVALPSSQYSGGSKCGKYVTVKNTKNGKSVKAMVRDECPGCGYGSLDLSKGAFQSIGSLDTGVLSISWSFA